MRLSTLLLHIFRFLLPPAILGTVYLYLYPIFQQCAFPEAKPTQAACLVDGTSGVRGEKAPFRLLALADPQLEGDTSIHDSGWESWGRIQQHFEGATDGGVNFGALWRDTQSLVKDDLPQAAQSWRKRLDLWGNDLYLAHVLRSVRWWTQPTHIVVLGDLLGSQWIGDEEFQRRSRRFWHTVFAGGKKVEDEIMDSSRTEVLGADRRWTERIITVAGNHDVGYAGDLNEDRVKRFEDAFGRVNWDVRFRLNDTNNNSTSGLGGELFGKSTPELRLVMLNSMNLDEPAKNAELRQQSLDFLDRKLHQEPISNDVGTVLLTHIPLYKEAGICVDGPFFDYFEGYRGGGVKEQNHLSQGISDQILDGVSGPQRRHKAIILNGHDHAGCQAYHLRANVTVATSDEDTPGPHEEERWQAQRLSALEPHTGSSEVREITVRSQMGEFGGNAGFLSAWWDNDTQEWKFEYDSCMCGVQHIWWAVHVLDIIETALGVGALVALLVEDISRPRPAGRVTITKKIA